MSARAGETARSLPTARVLPRPVDHDRARRHALRHRRARRPRRAGRTQRIDDRLGQAQERSLVGGPWPVSDRLRGRCHHHGDVRALAARTQRSPKPARFVQVIFGSLPQRLALCRQPTAPTRAPGRSSPSLWRRPTPIAIDPGSPKGSGEVPLVGMTRRCGHVAGAPERPSGRASFWSPRCGRGAGPPSAPTRRDRPHAPTRVLAGHGAPVLGWK